MSLVSLSLVVLAAFIHATWNLLSKRAADAGPTFVFAYNLVACVVYLPWMIWLLVYGDLPGTCLSLACLVLSALIHLAYSLCLQRGYQVADLSVVYPIARGTGPLLSSIGAFILLRETPTRAGHLGLIARRRRDRPHHHAGRSLGFPPPARPRRRALGHGNGLADRGLHRRRRLRRQAARHSSGRARLVSPICSASSSCCRSCCRTCHARERMKGYWWLAFGVGALSPLSYILVLTASRWARRSAWWRRRAKCR